MGTSNIKDIQESFHRFTHNHLLLLFLVSQIIRLPKSIKSSKFVPRAYVWFKWTGPHNVWMLSVSHRNPQAVRPDLWPRGSLSSGVAWFPSRCHAQYPFDAKPLSRVPTGSRDWHEWPRAVHPMAHSIVSPASTPSPICLSFLSLYQT